MQDTVKRLSLTRERLLRLLDDLDGMEETKAITIAMPPGMVSLGLRGGEQGRIGMPPELVDLASEVAEKSSTGVVVFWGEGVKAAVSPAFPVSRDVVVGRLDTKPLREVVERNYLVGVVLLRLGKYSMGMFKGYEAVATKSGSRLVHGRHRAGGSSSRRFERRREKQIFEILKEACEEVTERFGPFERQLEYILLGGERYTLLEFRKQCRFMQRMESRILGRVLAVDEPGHQALLRIPREVYKSQVWVREGMEGAWT
jgi:hypothetical protein